MSTKKLYYSEDLIKLFRTKKIAMMTELKAALGTSIDVTVFRKLNELHYHTSYSHRGKYYTLDEIAKFDQLGLWSFQSIHFSKYETLIQTAQTLVDMSEAGYFPDELEHILQVDVQDPLRKLAGEERLARKKVFGRFLYYSANSHIGEQQILARQIETASGMGLKQGTLSHGLITDELKASIVLFFSQLDEKQRRLFAGLESFKFGHGGDRIIADLFGMDADTVAKGRQQLLAKDFDVDRIRKPGGGRKQVKKKLQK